ncbi:uncharacterized protein METZ01_LOCUS163727 [marine metagenome]|uniref:DUF5723 domain-containing protein n=1 Tax=marine metagenome TaxID=408172 RepID=A0A382BC92_9ZZZZ
MIKRYQKSFLLIFYGLCFVNGQSGYQGLNSWYSPVTVSLGGGGTLLNIQEADRQNPAVLGRADNQKYILEIVRYPASVKSKHIGWISPKNKRVYSFHFRQMDYGRFDGYDEDGNPSGSYNSNDTWLSSSISSQYGMLSYGMSAGLFHSQLGSKKSIIMVSSFGGLISLNKQNMEFGIALKNQGIILKKFNSEENFPLSCVMSVSKNLAYLPLKLNLDIDFINDTTEPDIYLSGKFILSESVFLRWGINSERFNQQIESGVTKDLITGTGIGLGFKSGKYSIESGSYFYNPGNWILGISVGIYR